MNIIVLNGSPRKGNTVSAINALNEGLESAGHNVEVVDTYKLKVGPCVACGKCNRTEGCVMKDDTNMILDKMMASDMIIWATPVYWWGITAQLKLVLDKCYCRGPLLKGKKIGCVVVGGSPVDSVQYQLISDQFSCIEKYLGWERQFYCKYHASAKTDLTENAAALAELKQIGASVK